MLIVLVRDSSRSSELNKLPQKIKHEQAVYKTVKKW